MGGLLAHLPTVLSVQQFLTKNGMTPVPHPPKSPNLTQSEFFFVSPDEKVLKGKHFADVEEEKQKNGRSTESHLNR